MIVDASVALKWFLDEEDRDAAVALLSAEPLAAPDFLLLECANTFSVKVRQQHMEAERARQALTALRDDLGVRFWPSQPYITSAHEIALQLQRSAYDSLYLALAVAQRMTLVTADAKFARAVRSSPKHAPFVRLLSDDGFALEI